MTDCMVKEVETLIKISGITEIKSVYFGGGKNFELQNLQFVTKKYGANNIKKIVLFLSNMRQV